MSLTRRTFLETSVALGARIAAPNLVKAGTGGAAPVLNEQAVPAPTGEWMTATPTSAYRAYRSKPAKSADAATWVQIDLGEVHPIDYVKVYPANEKLVPGRDEDWAGEGFPVRFKIEVAANPGLGNPQVVVDQTAADFHNPKGLIQKFSASGVSGRFVRLTATRLMNVPGGGYYLGLGKVTSTRAGRRLPRFAP